ncbi:MAG: triacylglycerol lipase [Bradymonadaceae bacterium]|nr:triacylglycerol lipase [Lujinxingiaceae bacterium]
MKHYVYLSAGFFGFSNLGGITYFHHVREGLTLALAAYGIEAEIITVNTLPTASIRKRSKRLYDTIAATALDAEAPIHLIGHSTGGLDTRLLVTPSASLLDTDKASLERFASRVKSVVTVATPHLGAPSAAFFNSIFGQNLLWAMSLGTIYTLRFGRLPLSALFKLMGLMTHFDRARGLDNTILDQFYRELFADFDAERQAAISEFLDQILSDRDAVGQLTPGSIDIFNGTTADRPSVRYGCVVTKAAGLSARGLARLRFDPYAHASHTMFRMLQLLTSRNGAVPAPPKEQSIALVRGFGEMPDRRDNDGVVPTLSQLWGEVIHTAKADHLDVCGHFNDPAHVPPHVDWFISGSGFRRPDFEALWGDVAEFMARPNA